MSKLFTRSRINGGLSRAAESDTDEFGRAPSRGSVFGTSKKDKSLPKPLDKSARQRTISNPNLAAAANQERPGTPRDYLDAQDGFLATNLDPAPLATDEFGQPKPHSEPTHDYGYLYFEKHVILGLDEVVRLVDTVSEELRQRGLTTPLLFSPLALDINPNVIRKLVKAFLATCPHHRCLSITEQAWRDEARFSGPHELSMLLRWGLARIVRVERNIELRGFLSFDSYLMWRQTEDESGFSNSHFSQFVQNLDIPVRSLLASLFDLLSRFAAHSTSSGLTPSTIASLFGPLLFGLDSPSLAFSHTYSAYLRASHATEHLLLAYIRWQETQTQLKGTLPARLKDWIRGYPSMIPAINRMDKPHRGARMVRLGAVRRNVRLYSPDLVKTAASWSVPRGDFQTSKDWMRICPPNLKLSPRYSDTFRKYLNVGAGFFPELGPGTSSTNSTSSISSLSTLDSKQEFGALIGGPLKDENRFRSLTDMKWGEFESLGFSDTDNKKLAFDLTESARKSRAEKRATLTWNDFSEAGFTRSDDPLSATLQFSTPLATSISSWPNQSAELHRKLKKTQKALPAFGWDTTPVLGQEEVVEEGFLEVFCQLVYGSGWMERTETTFRECNWALVEFKSLPTQRPPTPPTGDPRTSSTLLLFEEFVPREYRDQLTAPKKKRLFAPSSLFSGNSKKQWKPASTLNGRPYVVGATPKPPSSREADFELLLREGNGSTTKVLSLSRNVTTKDHSHLAPTPAKPTVDLPMVNVPPVPPLPGSVQASGGISPLRSGTKNKFKLAARRLSTGIPPAGYDAVDFETREASDSEGDAPGSPNQSQNGRPSHARRQSKDDAWIDILIASDSRRRMAGQDALPTGSGSGRLRHNRSDPELAREEVAKALAGAGAPPPDDDDFFHRQGNASNDQNMSFSAVQSPEPYPYALPSTAVPPRPSFDDSVEDSSVMIRVQSPTIGSPSIASTTPPHNNRYIGDFEPVNHHERSLEHSQEVEVPRFVDDDHYKWNGSPSMPQSATLPPSPGAQRGTLPGQPSGGHVSSLVEKYQQQSNTNGLRSSSPNPPLEVLDPPAPLSEVTGRVSPARYVHGAPLHNVLEEEEE